MKTKITIPYRNNWLIMTGCVLLLALMVPLAVTFFNEREYGCVILCAFLTLFLLAGAWFRFNYGMWINDKKVVLLAQHGIRVVPRENIFMFVAKFTNQEVVAYMELKNGEKFSFIWEDITLDNRRVFPARGWGNTTSRVSIHLTDRFVERSIERLTQHGWIAIEDLYERKRVEE